VTYGNAKLHPSLNPLPEPNGFTGAPSSRKWETTLVTETIARSKWPAESWTFFRCPPLKSATMYLLGNGGFRCSANNRDGVCQSGRKSNPIEEYIFGCGRRRAVPLIECLTDIIQQRMQERTMRGR